MARRCGRIVHVERAAGQGFVEIPGAPRRNAGRRGPDHGLDLGLRHGLEDPLQDQEIDVFVAERKGQVIGKGVAGPVAFVEDGPGSLFPVAAADMLFGDATRPPDRRRNGQRVHERRPAGQSGAVGDGLLLEDRDRSQVKLHRSKILCAVENSHNMYYTVESDYGISNGEIRRGKSKMQ